jgi:hypothetical protein
MTAVELHVRRIFDPHLPARFPAGVPLMICGGCGAEGPLTSVSGEMWAGLDRGQAEALCESCASVEADELRCRMEAHASYLQDRGAWLLAMASWATITVDKRMYVEGPPEAAA